MVVKFGRVSNPICHEVMCDFLARNHYMIDACSDILRLVHMPMSPPSRPLILPQSTSTDLRHPQQRCWIQDSSLDNLLVSPYEGTVTRRFNVLRQCLKPVHLDVKLSSAAEEGHTYFQIFSLQRFGLSLRIFRYTDVGLHIRY